MHERGEFDESAREVQAVADANIGSAFVGSMILMGIGLVLSLRMHPERKFGASLAAEPSAAR